ncbi:peptidase M48 Ste24p [Dinoroseobacter shibae DFL 12 = DSM 16493]|jgi:Zn-dependent protease with chaperone function|uniref:Peptidase M48 Ste24p n=1 Tax=Dinoroseobacter shibae (strain DSM 16493 / NCIMB 14021 / DFL 12) TaxID=398580 RepID=A8LPD8_DINSH|nr:MULTISPECIES: M48 family metallopeptidase [Dinoroseobacter]ABV95203.1 peptidase M48 Ste24p [Dinoroseobacter shibae DFL 12 = DSM 16493]MDD9718078.1 M48 family metallopeptidase [Dinoroseobacter sp. PD6]URF46616.1 M48 family metallopeptidase [Dinoroseobacter shibae]URF50922.1 M48 family metallopeptidase [Dinoroseobacter shibae]
MAHPEQVILGTAVSGGTSLQVAARLLVRGDMAKLIAVETGGTMAEARLDAVRFDPPLGSLPRKLRFPDGAEFETGDREAIAALEPRGFWTRLHGWERLHPRLILFVVGGFAGGWLVYSVALTALVAMAVALTPEPLVRAMDRSTLSALDRVIASETALSTADQAEARAIFEDLRAVLPDRDLAEAVSLEFRALRGLGPNALALPGGTVVLSDALVKQFDADVVASVLGHEIAHVMEEHSLKRLYRSLGIYVMVALIAGETGPLLEDLLLEGNVLLSLSYSRGQEAEADQIGLRLADAAGYDPTGLKVFFETLAAEVGDGGGWLSTHPGNDDRIEAIDAYLEAR